MDQKKGNIRPARFFKVCRHDLVMKICYSELKKEVENEIVREIAKKFFKVFLTNTCGLDKLSLSREVTSRIKCPKDF